MIKGRKNIIFVFTAMLFSNTSFCQKTYYTDNIRNPVDPYKTRKSNFSVSGSIGIIYEHYGLDVTPDSFKGVRQRRPWNQVRFNLQPTLNFGEDWSIPFNVSLPAFPTNFAGPYAGIKNQTFRQWLSNPSNNLGIAPKYKWAQLLLGTQYIKYSDLSTGDIGIFGAGFDLRPKGWLMKFFYGTSQQGIDYIAPPPLPGVMGAYKRSHYMFQLGKEKEGKYLFALNFSKGKDDTTSVVSKPLTVMPQEGFAASLISEVYFLESWYVKLEAAQSYFTKDLMQPPDTTGEMTLTPFIDGRTSTQKDNAGTFSIGRKTSNFDIGYSTKYIGKTFQTTGYPYMQPDHWDNTIDTRFLVWKNKINVVARAGLRTNNMSDTLLKSDQFIGNINWFTQFNDHLGLNLYYNNFGFSSVSSINPYGIRNVSNDIGISPTYTWSTTNMMHLITVSYNYSKYDERDVITGVITSNNTQTGLISYNPVFFKSDLTPELSVLYFNNAMPLITNTLLTVTGGLGASLFKKKMQLRSQLQYTKGKLNAYTGNDNLIGSVSINIKITKKFTWSNFVSYNFFQYGTELLPAYPDGTYYHETFLRTGLQYKF